MAKRIENRSAKSVKITIIVIFLIVLMVGYYAYLSGRDKAIKQEAEMTVMQELLTRDLTRDYPPTPKEVIKLYNDITKCFYNENCTADEVKALGLMARELYDQELLDNNELGTYLIRLDADVEDNRNNSRIIMTAVVSSSTDVEYFTKNGYDFAGVNCTYTMSENKKNSTKNTIFLLRKDENKHWKIYGWADSGK